MTVAADRLFETVDATLAESGIGLAPDDRFEAESLRRGPAEA